MHKQWPYWLPDTSQSILTIFFQLYLSYLLTLWVLWNMPTKLCCLLTFESRTAIERQSKCRKISEFGFVCIAELTCLTFVFQSKSPSTTRVVRSCTFQQTSELTFVQTNLLRSASFQSASFTPGLGTTNNSTPSVGFQSQLTCCCHAAWIIRLRQESFSLFLVSWTLKWLAGHVTSIRFEEYWHLL